MTAPVAVTLCIINHDGAAHLKQSFQALRSQAWAFAEILLVDNASTDSSLEIARSLYPEATLIELPDNRGPGAARNAGFRAAVNDLILFQDNDVLLLSDTAERLVRHLHDFPDALLVSPRVVYADNPGTVQYDSADCHFLGLMATRNADVPVYNLGASPCETTSMVSACFLINRARWNGESLFDESFGFNLEDHDFGLRARLAGHSLWVQPQAVVRHGTGTPGLSYRPGGAASEQRLYFLTLNRWIVITKCYAGKTLAVLAPALLLFELMQFAWLAGQGRFRVWSRAMRGYWQARRRVYADRLLVQSSRCIPDAAILRDSPLPVTDRVRGGVLATALVAAADSLLRGYWHLVRRLL